MRYIFQLNSEENKEFVLLLQIDSEDTFYTLHQLIAKTCSYEEGQMASFFTVNAKGQRVQEISLTELSSENEELNVAVMDVSVLREFLDDKIETIEYVFDFFGDRYFTLKLEEIQEGHQPKAVVLKQKGAIPPQTSLEGFADVNLEDAEPTTDYEKYLSSFDDCKEGDLDFESLDELENEF